MVEKMTSTFHNPFKSWSPYNKIFFAGEGICHSYDEYGAPYAGRHQCLGQTFTSRLLWTPDYHLKGRTNLSQEIEKGFHKHCCVGELVESRRRPIMYVQREKGAKFMVIHMHGNGCDVGEMQPSAVEQAARWESHVILPEYPGYGEAPGRASVKDVEWAVMSAALFVLAELQVPPERIIVFGYSIGSGAACLLARALCEMDKPPAALILHAPYTSLRAMAVQVAGPIGNTTFNRFKTKRNLPYVTAPVLICHGDRDEVIPFWMGEECAKARKGCGYPTVFFTQPGCTHCQYNANQHLFLPGLDFLKEHVSGFTTAAYLRLAPYPQQYNKPPEDIKDLHRKQSSVSRRQMAVAGSCMCCAILVEAICGSFWLCWRGLKRNVIQHTCPSCIQNYELHFKGIKRST